MDVGGLGAGVGQSVVEGVQAAGASHGSSECLHLLVGHGLGECYDGLGHQLKIGFGSALAANGDDAIFADWAMRKFGLVMVLGVVLLPPEILD